MAQLVKNPLAMWETWVRSLGWEDLLEKGKATHPSILAWRIPWAVTVHGVIKSRTQLSDLHFHLPTGMGILCLPKESRERYQSKRLIQHICRN